jgi:diamine N-acetyltransferase
VIALDMDTSFVLARPNDLELLVGMMRQLRLDDPDEGAFDESKARDAIPPIVADPSIGRIWIIRCNSEPVGYVAMTLGWSLELGGRVAFVDELFIKASHRGRGIGTQTLDFVADKAKSLSVKSLLLEVTCTNESARRFYERCGYVDRKHRLMSKRLP